MAKATPTHYVEIGYQKFVGTLAQCQAAQRAMEVLRTAGREYLDVGPTKTKWYTIVKGLAATEVGRIEGTPVSPAEWAQIEAESLRNKQSKRPKIESRSPAPLLLEYRDLPDGGGVR